MEGCEFCQIVDGERNAHFLYENERTAAFLDRNPAIQGHSLVVPKTHHEFLFTEDEARVSAVFETVRTVARAMNQTLDPDGVSLFYTSAELVGRVTHAHVHVLPRYVDDDIHLALSRDSLDTTDAASLAQWIRLGL